MGIVAGFLVLTFYSVVDEASKRAAWIALRPITGRTHQLRVHCAAMGTPILGDGKYGGRAAFLDGVPEAKKLHLHARNIRIPHPDGGTIDVTATLPEHIQQSWNLLGLEEADGDVDVNEVDSRFRR